LDFPLISGTILLLHGTAKNGMEENTDIFGQLLGIWTTRQKCDKLAKIWKKWGQMDEMEGGGLSWRYYYFNRRRICDVSIIFSDF
jgi:hypothetical protein